MSVVVVFGISIGFVDNGGCLVKWGFFEKIVGNMVREFDVYGNCVGWENDE